MPKVELDETTALSQVAIIKVVDDIVKNPKHRDSFLKAVKDVRPDMSIPEIDVAGPLRDELAAIRKEQADFITAQQKLNEDRNKQSTETDFVANWRRQKNEMLDAGYMHDAVEAIERFAQENGIPNLEAAAALYEKRNPPQLAAPRSLLADAFNPASDAGQYTKNLLEARLKGGKPAMEALASQEVSKTLSDVRSAVRRF